MAYQPTYPSPYMETIDAYQEGGNNFKCLVNPKDTVLDAVVNIYNNDIPAEYLVHTGGEQTAPSSDTTQRTITFIETTIDVYYKIEQLRRRGETLSIKIVDTNNRVHVRTISQIICPLSSSH